LSPPPPCSFSGWCGSESARLEALRTGKDSGDAAFRRGNINQRKKKRFLALFFFLFPFLKYRQVTQHVVIFLLQGKFHAAVALYSDALSIDALAEAVNAVL